PTRFRSVLRFRCPSAMPDPKRNPSDSGGVGRVSRREVTQPAHSCSRGIRLHVHVDARLLHGGGIGRYVRELTSRWLLRADVGRICFLGRPDELTPFLARHDRRGVGAVVPWTDPPYSAIAQARWPRLARACGDDPNVT